jgi:hypothetical protein
MIGHQYPSMYLQSLVADAIVNTVYHDLPVVITCKNIDPVHNSKCYEIGCILVPEFVPDTHSIKIIGLSYIRKSKRLATMHDTNQKDLRQYALVSPSSRSYQFLNRSGTGPIGIFAGGVFALIIMMSLTPLPPFTSGSATVSSVP